MSEAEFKELIDSQPVKVASVKYVVQSAEYKSLYPDLLRAVVTNDSADNIKNIDIAFVAWDKNNLPVRIIGVPDFSDGVYVKENTYLGINLASGGSFGKSDGVQVNYECGIDKLEAIVISYQTFDDEYWDNPYYDEWCLLYEAKEYSENLSVDVVIEEEKEESSSVSEETLDLLSRIDAQEVKVVSTEYIINHPDYKSLYPDELQAVIQNGSSQDIKNVTVAFVAWDKDKFPVKILGAIDFSDGEYVKLVDFENINLAPQARGGAKEPFAVNEECGIRTFKAIVVSYETLSGEVWNNPLFSEWRAMYEGVKLPE